MELAIDIISGILLLLGSFLCVSGGVGILRFPDFYNRLHAAGVTDTLATAMILIGLMLLTTDVIVIAKLIIILLMTLFISPTASHAVAQAAIRNDLEPELASHKKQKRKKKVRSSKS